MLGGRFKKSGDVAYSFKPHRTNQINQSNLQPTLQQTTKMKNKKTRF